MPKNSHYIRPQPSSKGVGRALYLPKPLDMAADLLVNGLSDEGMLTMAMAGEVLILGVEQGQNTLLEGQ